MGAHRHLGHPGIRRGVCLGGVCPVDDMEAVRRPCRPRGAAPGSRVLVPGCLGAGSGRGVRARRPRVPRGPGPAVPPVPSMLVAVGFCSIRGWLSACRRRVGSLMPPFPPFGGSPSVALVSVVPKVQTTSVKNAENRGVVVEVVCVLGAVVSVVVAVLAAGPLCWQHEPFNAQLNPIGGMVGSLPRPPPIGLTCGSSSPRAQDTFTETKEGHTAHRRPDAPHVSSDTTEAGP